MKYSVIIPVYNAARTLRRCLDSLVDQSFDDYELLLINDGSTDGSDAICREYANAYPCIRYFAKENGGISSARNLGLEQAKGEYILFVDSDDWLSTETLQRAAEAAAQKDADIVIWAYTREYSQGSFPVQLLNKRDECWCGDRAKTILRRLFGPVGPELASPQSIDNLVTAWGKLYKRELLNGEAFEDARLIASENLLFNVPVFYKANTIVYMNATLYHYYKDNEYSLTHRYPENLPEQYEKLQNRMLKFVNENALPEEYCQALQNRICLSLIGTGLRLVEDHGRSMRNVIEELRRIRNMPHYAGALKQLPLRYFPLHWKAFFFAAKARLYLLWCVLLKIMNRLRSRV